MDTSEYISYCNFCLSKDATVSDSGGSFANCHVGKIMMNIIILPVILAYIIVRENSNLLNVHIYQVLFKRGSFNM